MPAIVTKDFQRAWQWRCATKNAARERRYLKHLGHRRMRRAQRQLLSQLEPALSPVKPISGWDVI